MLFSYCSAFNLPPRRFGKQYDKNGDYIRHFLPALKVGCRLEPHFSSPQTSACWPLAGCVRLLYLVSANPRHAHL